MLDQDPSSHLYYEDVTHSICAILKTNKKTTTDKQTESHENITSLVEVKIELLCIIKRYSGVTFKLISLCTGHIDKYSLAIPPGSRVKLYCSCEEVTSAQKLIFTI